MKPIDVLKQVRLENGKIVSLSSNKIYEKEDFVKQISQKLGWTVPTGNWQRLIPW